MQILFLRFARNAPSYYIWSRHWQNSTTIYYWVINFLLDHVIVHHHPKSGAFTTNGQVRNQRETPYLMNGLGVDSFSILQVGWAVIR